jgi:hypothetical protein
MVTREHHYQFLKQHYKHDRFEGRNGNGWGKDYSSNVARGSYQALENYGYTCISQHESKTGDAVWYDRDLAVKPYHELRSQYGA